MEGNAAGDIGGGPLELVLKDVTAFCCPGWLSSRPTRTASVSARGRWEGACCGRRWTKRAPRWVWAPRLRTGYGQLLNPVLRKRSHKLFLTVRGAPPEWLPEKTPRWWSRCLYKVLVNRCKHPHGITQAALRKHLRFCFSVPTTHTEIPFIFEMPSYKYLHCNFKVDIKKNTHWCSNVCFFVI